MGKNKYVKVTGCREGHLLGKDTEFQEGHLLGLGVIALSWSYKAVSFYIASLNATSKYIFQNHYFIMLWTF